MIQRKTEVKEEQNTSKSKKRTHLKESDQSFKHWFVIDIDWNEDNLLTREPEF